MKPQKGQTTIHPKGEPNSLALKAVPVDTFGGRIHVEWDPQAAVTPLGQLSFFIEFLKTAELFDPWVKECPLTYTSPNAPKKRDVLGTLMLSLLAGHKRYAHMTSIRADTVNPALLGMTKVASEDSVRRAFQKVDAEAGRDWQCRHLRRCWEPLLYEPWILDIDTTVKTLYGHQEGAEVGYNPHKPGRPSHVYHTYWIANVRLVLDAEVQPGNQGASSFSRPQLFEFLDGLSAEERPTFLRGDCGFGNEGTMMNAEQRGLDYLFKLRQTKKVKGLIESLMGGGEWSPAGQGWEGTEARLQLSGWSRERRVIVLRRELKREVVLEEPKKKDQLEFGFLETLSPCRKYEYAVLITSLPDEIMTVAQHYRDRADSENGFDELKNQWSWCGFTTQDLHRCQVMARMAALVYNWWSLFVRLAIPGRHAEAITSRPLLLYAVGKQTQHGGQTKITLTSIHGHYQRIRERLVELTAFLRYLRESAEQLDWYGRWRLILSRAFVQFLHGRTLQAPHRLQFNT